jgi:hypothetical protein
MEIYFQLRQVFDEVWVVDELPLGPDDRKKVKDGRVIMEHAMEDAIWNAKQIHDAKGPRFGSMTQWAANVKQEGDCRRLAADILAEAGLG